MVNTKSLMLMLSVLSLGLTALGLGRFAVDLWRYFQPAGGISNHRLDYGALWAALTTAGIAAVFFFVYRKIRH